MKLTATDFGQLDNTPIKLFTLQNDNKLTVKITNYGATITSITLPDASGKIEEIVCGFDTLDSYFSDAYQANAPYFGGTVGRYCSQIKDAKFKLNGETYQLAKIVGDNNLHGGKLGFDKRIWTVKNYDEAIPTLTLSLKSEHLEEGFPGNVDIAVTFSLTNDNELKIHYHATTDADTPFTMTNHTYFNLTGFKDSVEGHFVQVNADTKQVWDNTGAATGENSAVVDQPDDLREPKQIGEVHQAMEDGFEHFYLFPDKGFRMEEVADFKEPNSGRTLKVATTEPGMLLYTGKYTADNLQRENGLQYGKYRGFCCETHRYPNGPNLKNAPKSILRQGEKYDSTTIFTFGW